MNRVMKPEELIRFYDEVLKSMQRYPGEWLSIVHDRMSTCKDPEGRLMWQAAAKRCRCIIAQQRK